MDIRQLAGRRFVWEMARTASAPAAKVSKVTPQLSLWTGLGRTRTQASVIIDKLVYTDASGEHAVDVCGDRAMASMRTTRLGSGPGCTFVFGNGANGGWIGPSALKNLGASTAPRKLRVRMTGELTDEVHVYLDQGTGYSSPIRLKVEPAVTR